MIKSTPKRVGLAAAAIAICVAAWWWLRPPDGFLTGLVPLEGNRAVFTMRHNPNNGDARAWLGLLDASGEVAWSKELPALTYSVYAHHGLTVSDDQITIKVSDSNTFAQVLAFDLETGAERWQSPRIDFAESDASFMMPSVPGERPHTDGVQLIHGDADGSRNLLVARSAADGARLWEHAVDSGVRDLLFASDAVAYRADAAWTFLSRGSGEVVQQIHAYAAGCGAADQFVTWDDDQLITVDWSGPAFTVASKPLPSEGIPLYCGLRDGAAVFTVARRYSEIAERRFELTAVDQGTASVAWRLDLGPWEPSSIARSRDNDTPDAHPLRGSLTDFVPVLLGTHDNDGVKLAMLDLNKHRVDWESTPHAELLHFDVFRGPGAQYFLGDSGRIAAFDGKTGKLTAAIRLGHESTRAFHALGNQLWLFSMGWHRMDALPWARLDGATLEVLAAGNDAFRPRAITDEFSGWLGIAAQ